MSIADYTVPIPRTATICPDWPSLCEETRMKWAHTMLFKKYGGHVIEDEGANVLVCTDELYSILEEKDRQAKIITFHGLGSGVSLSNYNMTMPQSAKIISDWPSLEAAAMRRRHTAITKKYADSVIEEDGVIAIVCDERLSAEAEAHPEPLEWTVQDMAEQR